MKYITLTFLILISIALLGSCNSSHDEDKCQATIDSLNNEVLKYKAISEKQAEEARLQAEIALEFYEKVKQKSDSMASVVKAKSKNGQ